MKKYIFTANVIVLVALVPAIFIGYLHNDSSKTENKENTEIVKEVNTGNTEGISLLNLVKNF